MYANCRRNHANIIPSLGLFIITAAAPSAYAEGAIRDLSNYTSPGATFTVLISLVPPKGTEVVALEDAPPVGWPVSNISDGGIWDSKSEKVKWGLFFAPSIPDVVTYDVTPPDDAMGMHCLAGIVSFDGLNQPVEGMNCIAVAIPTLAEWGMVVMALLILIAGTVAIDSQITQTDRFLLDVSYYPLSRGLNACASIAG